MRSLRSPACVWWIRLLTASQTLASSRVEDIGHRLWSFRQDRDTGVWSEAAEQGCQCLLDARDRYEHSVTYRLGVERRVQIDGGLTLDKRLRLSLPLIIQSKARSLDHGEEILWCRAHAEEILVVPMCRKA